MKTHDLKVVTEQVPPEEIYTLSDSGEEEPPLEMYYGESNESTCFVDTVGLAETPSPLDSQEPPGDDPGYPWLRQGLVGSEVPTGGVKRHPGDQTH